MRVRMRSLLAGTLILLGLLVSACGPAAGGMEAVLEGSGKEASIGQLSGVVEQIRSDAWVIDGTTLVTGRAEIQEQIGVGDRVQVEFEQQADGSLSLSKIELLSSAGDSEFEFSGVVESISAREWVVSSKTVLVGDGTEIKGDIQSGDRVKVHASLDSKGMLTAREIELANIEEGHDREEIEFTGEVTAIDGEEWSIGALIVLVTPETEVKGDLGVGDMVKVHASRTAEGDLLAREIEPISGSMDLDHDDDREFEFTGIVMEIGAESWQIDETLVLVDSRAEIEPGIEVGDFVEVEGVMDQDTFVALEIEADDDEEDVDDHDDGEDHDDSFDDEEGDDHDDYDDEEDDHSHDDDDQYEDDSAEGGYDSDSDGD